MSEQVIDRATLEKKDKGELTTIVNALGGKATSRMKKADLIDLILDRSGVVVAASEAGVAADVAGAEDSARPASAADDSQADAGSEGPTERVSEAGGRVASGSRGGDGRRSDPDSNETSGSARRAERGQGERNDRNKSDRPGSNDRTQGDRNQGDRNQGDRGRSQADRVKDSGQNDQQKAGQQQGGQQKGGQQQAGQQQDGQPNGAGNQQARTDDAESGNRRRRRRGRGRDRDEMNDPVSSDPVAVSGILDLREDGYGFVRVDGLLPSKDDVYVPVKMVRQFGLRRGDHLTGTARPANRNEKNPALAEVASINGRPADDQGERPEFDQLTPIHPSSPMTLERADDVEPGGDASLTGRLLDLVSPMGLGQRTLVVAPPRSGKSTLLTDIARSIDAGHPDVELVVLMIDERPEEVTDMVEHLGHGDVVASPFDRPADEHCAVAELTLERAKRMVEAGSDVVIILDGLTRLARAYNTAGIATGRTLAGGIDAGAIYPPKHFFGSARNVAEGGSLTVIATIAAETGHAIDDTILGEFEGTANSVIRLDRLIAERLVFPAIDLTKSGTRRESELFEEDEQAKIAQLRVALSGLISSPEVTPAAATERFSQRVAATSSNTEFLNEIAQAPSL